MSMKISDLVKLIEACGRAGVKKLVHETENGLPINLEFYEARPEVKLPIQETEVSLPKDEAAQALEYLQNVSNQKLVEVSQEFDRQERLRLLEEDFDILPIADPEKYEELLANGKLDDFGEAHA